MRLVLDEEDVKHVDEDSVILDKCDCMMFLRPIDKGFCLPMVKIDGLDEAAPLIFNLCIPVDMCIPDNVSDPKQFAREVISAASPECNAFIIDHHNISREDDADLFIAVIDIYDTTSFHTTGKVSWRIPAFPCHKRQYDCIIGVDNLMYHNISKRIDELLN
jgi:hypothetical protein